MTNSEAIETLKANYPDPCFELLREAVDTAIYALSAQPEIRTCIYEGKLAIWHRWVEINDIDKPIRAMVETYDGRIHFVMPWNIQFINTDMVINNLTKGESNDRD